MLDRLSSTISLLVLVLFHAIAIAGIAVIARGLVWLGETLFGDHVPQAIEVAEAFTLWFVILAFLVQAGLDVIEYLVKELRGMINRMGRQ